jgi:hypothetical protein
MLSLARGDVAPVDCLGQFTEVNAPISTLLNFNQHEGLSGRIVVERVVEWVTSTAPGVPRADIAG